MLANLSALVAEVTAALDDYDYARALQRIESFFWDFCDNYRRAREVAAVRRAGPEARPRRMPRCRRRSTCCCGCSRRIVPFATEEVWSWWHDGIVHRASWPSTCRRRRARSAGAVDVERDSAYATAVGVLGRGAQGEVRRQTSPKAVVSRVTWQVPGEDAALLAEVADDLEGRSRSIASMCSIGPAGAMTIELEPETSARTNGRRSPA